MFPRVIYKKIRFSGLHVTSGSRKNNKRYFLNGIAIKALPPPPPSSLMAVEILSPSIPLNGKDHILFLWLPFIFNFLHFSKKCTRVYRDSGHLVFYDIMCSSNFFIQASPR